MADEPYPTDRLKAVREGVRGHGTVNRPQASTGSGPGKDYGETAHYRNPVEPGHVLVATEHGRNPGILIEWRKPAQLPWEGRVAHTRLVNGKWVKVVKWLPAGAITPTSD